MQIQSINYSQNNTNSFGANIELNRSASKPIKEGIRKVKNTEWAKDILNRFLAHAPEQTVRIGYSADSYKTTIWARNTNNNRYVEYCDKPGCNIGELFFNFLSSVLENKSFWKNTEPTPEDLINHDVFVKWVG